MTNEEASYLLANSDRTNFDEFMNEALDMGIKALEQEPCEDCISRKAVLDINHNHHGEMPNHINHQIWEEINALPPIQPKPKTDVLDKIRAEIERLRADLMTSGGVYEHSAYGLDYAMQIIDKYTAESEDKE